MSNLQRAFRLLSFRTNSGVNISRHNSTKTPEVQEDPKASLYPNTTDGIKERTVRRKEKGNPSFYTPIPPHPDGKNPKTGEVGGPGGPEPTRFGDWERKGRVTDF